MARVMKPSMEVFPPSDRELALRAQIRTGWSTITNRDAHQSGLNPSEVKHIQQVLEKAQAMEHMEQIRIGLQVLKHKQSIDSCRGDGLTTCRICGRDFSNKRSHKPEPIQYCVDCQKVVCTRCRVPDKALAGENVVLCNICMELRELWKKSGSWLNNTSPDLDNFSIPTENLEEIQEKMSHQRRPTTGRKRSATAFTNPYLMEDEDQDDDESDISPPLSDSQRINFSPSPRGSPSPIPHMQNISKSFDLDFSAASHSRSSSMDDDFRATSSVTDLNDQPRIRSRGSGTGLSRRRAITKEDRNRLMMSRERAHSNSRRHGAGVPLPSLSSSASVPFGKVSDGEDSSGQQGVPSIKIRKPSTQHVQDYARAQSLPMRQPLNPVTGDSDTDTEKNKPFKVVRQIQKMSSTESDVMVMGGEYLPPAGSPSQQIDVEDTITTAVADAARKRWDECRSSASSSSPEHFPTTPSPQLQQTGTAPAPHQPRGHVSATKQRSSPGVTSSSTTRTPEKKTASLDRTQAPDLFKKVGGGGRVSKSPVSAKAETEGNFSQKEQKSDSNDLFKKVGGSKVPEVEKKPSQRKPDDSDDLFKKVSRKSASPEAEPATVGKKSESSDLFKKVGGAASAAVKMSSQAAAKKSGMDDQFKKVGVAPSPRGSKSPPTAAKTDDLFKKVGGAANAVVKMSSQAAAAKKSGTDDLFKKVGGAPTSAVEKKPAAVEKSETDDLFKKVGGARDKSPEKKSPIRDMPTELVSKPAVVAVKAAPLMSSPPQRPALVMPPPPKNPPPTMSSPPNNLPPTMSPPPKNPPPTMSSSPAPVMSSPPRNPPPTMSPSPAPVTSSPPKNPPPTMTSPPKQPAQPAPPKNPSPLPSSSPSHPPSSKPVPVKRRLLPTLPQEGAGQSPLSSLMSPELQKKKLGDLGKQESSTSAISVLSEMSTTMETDSAMDSPTSVTSSGSSSSNSKVTGPSDSALSRDRSPTDLEGSLDRSPQQGITRRNATRSGGRRPHPRPRGMIADNIKSEGSGPPPEAEKPLESSLEADDLPRLRTRSGAVRRPGRKMTRPLKGASGSSDSKPGADFPDFPGDDGSGGESLGRRSRGSTLTTKDQSLAKVARETAGSSSGGRGKTPPKVKPDGEFGSIQMSLEFDEDKSELRVTVHSCRGLRGMDKNGLSDPYVKLYLQPGSKLQKFRTKTIFKNLNPKFQESFTFPGISKDSLEKKRLCVVVMDYDELSSNDMIGGTQVNLYEVMSSSTREICIKRLLDDRSVPKHELIIKDRGMLHFALRYSMEKKALLVSMHGAKNISVQGHCDAYVKCHWMSRGRTIKVKTKTLSKAAEPVFNEDLEIPAALRDLTYCTLVVSLWERRNFKDKQLGEVQLSSVTFWKGFTHDPTKVVEDWFTLEAPSHSHANHIPSPTARMASN